MKFLLLILILIIPISAQQQKWQKLNGPVGANVTFLEVKGDTLIVASGHKGTIFYSLNGGEDWKQSNIKINNAFISCAISKESVIVAAKEKGIYKSVDLVNWNQIFNTGKEFRSVGLDLDGNLYAGTNHTEIYISTDYGAEWNLEYDGYPSGSVNNFHLSDSILWAGAYNRVLFKSFKSTPLVWDSCQGIPIFGQFYRIFSDNADNVFAYGNSRIIRTSDEGASWIELDTGRFFSGNYIYSMIFNDRLIAGCGDETGWFGDGWGVALSDDGGLTWRWQNNGLPPKIFNVKNLNKFGNITYSGTSSAGVFKSTDHGVSWSPINNGLNAADVFDITLDNEETIYSANWSNGFQKSTDKGQSWEVINNGLTNSYCYSIIADDNGILLGGTDQGTFRSTDEGENWVQAATVGNNFSFRLYKDKQNRIYSLNFDGGLHRTSDLGNTWQRIDNNFISPGVFAFTIDSSGNLYAGTRGGWIYKSTNYGNSWFISRTGINSITFGIDRLRTAPNGYIFAATINEGVLRSTDSGLSWENINSGITGPIINSLGISSKGEIFVSAAPNPYLITGDKIYYSNNNGESWQDFTSNLNSMMTVRDIIFDTEDFAYLATDESVWKFNPDSTTSVQENEVAIAEYKLVQNYPNPFNPSTKISYSLKDEGYVKLHIYDIKGELVTILVNEKQQAGGYEVDFTLPGNISTGVYIYRLTVSDNSSKQIFSDVKKMLYLK